MLDSPASSVLRTALAAFRSLVTAQNCEDVGGTSHPKPFRYADDDVTYRRAFDLGGRGLLIGLGLRPDANTCDGPAEEAEWTPHWFWIDPSGRAHHLGFAMHFVDAAGF